MAPTVSIIVPVYNAEKTIGRCIDSILGQQYTDFELLLVDDGSKDGSGAICDSYALADSRVQVIHKENTGVSDTRNIGISRARGVYLQFLDSDDWITPDATKLLVEAAGEHNCDLVISDFYRVVGERVSRKGDIDEDRVLTREEYAAHMMEQPADFYYGVLWNKLYRRDIVADHHLQMDPEISWCEDFMFNLEYIRHAQRFYALQVPIYYYVKTKGSLASQSLSISKTIRMKLMLFEYYNQFYKSVLDEDEYEKSRLKVYRFLVDAAGDGAVPPTILPGSKKLGDERVSICPEALSGEGVLADSFRERKLLEQYLESAALKNGLSLPEARLLLALVQMKSVPSRKNLADFLGVSRSSLSMNLQKLTSKGLIRAEDIRDEETAKRQFQVAILPDARPVLEDLAAAQQGYIEAHLTGFTGEEAEQFALLMEKARANTRRALQ
ncbi:MAG: glycosyltransferase [Dysosmobacter sp.]|nr:glycosyltransferase [Dysosmobacter sp.]